MSSLKLKHSGGNSVIIAGPSSNPAADRTINLNDNYAGDGSFVTANSSGNVGIGTASPPSTLSVEQSSSNVAADLHTTGSGRGSQIKFHNDHAVAYVGQAGDTTGDFIVYNGSNSNMLFSTNAAERMRIDSSGTLCIGTTSVHNTGKKLSISSTNHAMEIQLTNSNNVRCITLRHGRASGGTGGEQITFENSDGSSVGTIESTGSATSFNTSSDYRLKENITAISDGITRLKTLKPSRFNFKVDKDTTVDGFLAHEVTAVPEAVKGTKDEVATTDDDAIGLKKGDPIYQRIDHSKLVPLLTAALQEAIAKIETLETKVAALEAG